MRAEALASYASRASDIAALFRAAGDPAQAMIRLRQPFTTLVPNPDRPGPIVLFGAGPWGRFTAERLAATGLPAAAFADNAERIWGGTIAGLPVMSPADAVERYGDHALFVATIYNGDAVRRQLVALGCRRVLAAASLYYGLPDTFLPYYQLDRPDRMFAAREAIETMDGAWHDGSSQMVYRSRLATALGLPPAPDEPIGSPADCYFDPELFHLAANDCVVDCGAFDGDTIRRLLSAARSSPRVVALEPDPENAQALRAFVASLPAPIAARITVVEAAASDTNGRIAFDASGTVAAQAGAGALQVRTLTLDTISNVVADANPTFVKMDVEGHELQALEGTTKLLAARSPILAISLYHRTDDLWRIPLFIHRANPGYRLFLRCYAEDGWESVCYAVPATRALA